MEHDPNVWVGASIWGAIAIFIISTAASVVPLALVSFGAWGRKVPGTNVRVLAMPRQLRWLSWLFNTAVQPIDDKLIKFAVDYVETVYGEGSLDGTMVWFKDKRVKTQHGSYSAVARARVVEIYDWRALVHELQHVGKRYIGADSSDDAFTDGDLLFDRMGVDAMEAMK